MIRVIGYGALLIAMLFIGLSVGNQIIAATQKPAAKPATS